MSLFEIELNSDFKILNASVFLNENEFKKFYKLNNLNDGNDTIPDYLSNELMFKVYHDSFCMTGWTYETEEISDIVKFNIYSNNENSNEKELYPEWLLFYIAIKKQQISSISEKEFKDNIELFKYIAEIRYKKYVVRNVKNYICFNKYGQSNEIREMLHQDFLKYLDNSKFEINELFKYLTFLMKLHRRMKDIEKYKLMWNLESYILEVITLLLDQKTPIEDIYKKIGGGTYSELHQVHVYKPLYLKESKDFFTTFTSMKKMENIFGNINQEDIVNGLLDKNEYEDILFSYMEIINRLNANKRNEIAMGAMIRGVVLGVEKLLINSLRVKPTELIDAIQSKELISKRKNRENLNKFLEKTKIPKDDYDNQIFFTILNKFIGEEQDETIEKYLVIYHRARNYLAHNNIDMDKFFWGEDGNRTIISNVIDSVMIILYKIEEMKITKSDTLNI